MAKCTNELLTGTILWYDKRDGKAVHTVNHLHDKPLEMTVMHTISERMKLALEKAEARVRSRN